MRPPVAAPLTSRSSLLLSSPACHAGKAAPGKPRCHPRARAWHTAVRHVRSTTRCSASADAGPFDYPAAAALGPEGLERFCQVNAGLWHGTFLQFDLQGKVLQNIPVALTATAQGNGDSSSLHQILRIRPGPGEEPDATTVVYPGETSHWTQWEIPEINRLTVDTRQQVGFFEEEGAYAVSHQTAEVLEQVLRVGAMGQVKHSGDGDKDTLSSPQSVRLPSSRPALVSEACLSAPLKHTTPQHNTTTTTTTTTSTSTRARAFVVLDPRGLTDSLAVFLEGREEDPQPQIGPAFEVSQILGTWKGTARMQRSELYGGTVEHQEVETTYTAQDEQLLVVSKRGGRTLDMRALRTVNVLQYNGGLQTVHLPGGMSLTFPQIVPRGSSFFFEFAWILPDGMRRQRIIRTFDPEGLVVSTTHVKELRL